MDLPNAGGKLVQATEPVDNVAQIGRQKGRGAGHFVAALGTGAAGKEQSTRNDKENQQLATQFQDSNHDKNPSEAS
jgi:hypothetical protein